MRFFKENWTTVYVDDKFPAYKDRSEEWAERCCIAAVNLACLASLQVPPPSQQERLWWLSKHPIQKVGAPCSEERLYLCHVYVWFLCDVFVWLQVLHAKNGQSPWPRRDVDDDRGEGVRVWLCRAWRVSVLVSWCDCCDMLVISYAKYFGSYVCVGGGGGGGVLQGVRMTG